jgi:hypothetical protein
MDQSQILELFKKIDEKVDKISISQAKLEVNNETFKDTMANIRADLNYHIKRTDLLETELTKLRGFFFYFSVAVGFAGAAITIVTNIWGMIH